MSTIINHLNLKVEKNKDCDSNYVASSKYRDKEKRGGKHKKDLKNGNFVNFEKNNTFLSHVQRIRISFIFVCIFSNEFRYH